MNYAQSVKDSLSNIISSLASHPEPYVKHPGKDFTRSRKLDFKNTLETVISMGGNSVKLELLDFFRYTLDSPTASAFCQQREKLSIKAFETVFYKFNEAVPCDKTYHGYQLIACDGSDLNFFRTPEETEYYHDPGHSANGYNLMHLNALYDLLERRYLEVLLQPAHGKDEFCALTTMVDRYSPNNGQKVIFIGDRGYSSYNVFAHIIKKGQYFLIRTKDKGRKGMVNGIDLPDSEEFDVTVTLRLVRRQTKVAKSIENRRFVCKNVSFDFLEYGSAGFYPLTLRIVRFALPDGSYECVVTNLPADTFPPSELKALYIRRWGIETSFRELKYAVGLTHFHSKKPEYIKQEVWARLILYNFCETIVTHAVIAKKHTKHAYQVNFTLAIQICRHFLRQMSLEAPMDVDTLIRRHVLPVRENRKATCRHKVNFRKPISFIYRVA